MTWLQGFWLHCFGSHSSFRLEYGSNDIEVWQEQRPGMIHRPQLATYDLPPAILRIQSLASIQPSKSGTLEAGLYRRLIGDSPNLTRPAWSRPFASPAPSLRSHIQHRDWVTLDTALQHKLCRHRACHSFPFISVRRLFCLPQPWSTLRTTYGIGCTLPTFATLQHPTLSASSTSRLKI